MDELNKKDVIQFYEENAYVWPNDNAWHAVNQSEIHKAVHGLQMPLDAVILNAGSGGSIYGLPHTMHNLDVVSNKNVNLENFTLGSIENIPFDSQFFDYVICVGSVLNYCDAAKAIQQFSRVLKPQGILLLEFESSTSFEFKGTDAYNKNATIITTQYLNSNHDMWVFSPRYIEYLLLANNFTIKAKRPYHIISGLAFNRNHDENVAARYTKYDGIVRRIPVISKHCGNMIITLVKN